MLIIFGVVLIACAFAVFMVQSHLVAVLAASLVSMTLAILYGVLQAPDVALAEAAVGVAFSGIIYFFALYHTDLLTLRGTGDDDDA